MRGMRRVVRPGIWAWGLLLPLALTAQTTVKTVAVLNFANRARGGNADRYQWLEKGLADLTITDLASQKDLRVVTREHMQMLLEEARVISTLNLPDAAQEGFGRKLQVDHLVFGSFAVTGDQIAINVQLTDVKTGAVRAVPPQRGPVDQVLNLQKAMATAVIRALMGRDDAAAVPVELPHWTDSVPAAEDLYTGIELFDRGQYHEAWFHFRKASTRDAAFADARYWIARILYYLEEYEHAQVEYTNFVDRFPRHPRTGDAIMEYVHTFERTTPDPELLGALYRNLSQRDLPDSRVYHQADYVSSSPLADWLAKRQYQVLLYQKKHQDAFRVLQPPLAKVAPYSLSIDAKYQPWEDEGVRLLAAVAELSEDGDGVRLDDAHLPFRTLVLTPENLHLEERIGPEQNVRGSKYAWGHKFRVVAAPGYYVKSVKATIKRTNDAECDSVSRLQIFRYRYVDIESFWTGNNTKPEELTRTVRLPPNCTWFYMRPEYDARDGARKIKREATSSFDGWSLDAELGKLEPGGQLAIAVTNSSHHQTLVDGAYARCYDGVVSNLAVGPHQIEVRPIWNSSLQPLHFDVDIKPGGTVAKTVNLAMAPELAKAGWQTPVPVAVDYPWYRFRPKRLQVTGSQPALCHDRTGRWVALWAHLDDLWLATSMDGQKWEGPTNLGQPVNSAHVEMAPRLIQDRSGRFCLAFLSDRGQLRNYATYTCWSHDLEHWSRPVLVTPAYHADHDFLQIRDGHYVLVATERGDNSNGILLRTSPDLVQWDAPVALEPTFSGPNLVRLAQDDSGGYHLAFTMTTAYYASSANLKEWPGAKELPEHKWPDGLLLTTIGDQIILGSGAGDGYYGGNDRIQFIAKHRRDKEWRKLSRPANVIDPLFNLSFDAEHKQFLFLWQTLNMSLNPVLPSGPVYAMTARPTDWPGLKEETAP